MADFSKAREKFDAAVEAGADKIEASSTEPEPEVSTETITEPPADLGELQESEGLPETVSDAEVVAPTEDGDTKELHTFKANGKDFSVDYSEMQRLASMGKHTESKREDANKAIQEAEIAKHQYQARMNDPETLVQDLIARGVDLQRFVQSDKADKETLPEIRNEEFTEYDDDETKRLKQEKNTLNAHLSAMRGEIENIKNLTHRQGDVLVGKDLKAQFDKSRDMYGVPQNAELNVLALFEMGRNRIGGTYTMENALGDYVRGLGQKTGDFDSVLANEELSKKLKDHFVTDYNKAVKKRDEENKVVERSGKVSPPSREKAKGSYEGFQRASKNAVEAVNRILKFSKD